MLDAFAPLPVVGRTYTWCEDGFVFKAYMRPDANYDIFISTERDGFAVSIDRGIPVEMWSEAVDYCVALIRKTHTITAAGLPVWN